MRPTQTSRRDALKLGGLSISLAAVAAACGENRGGDTAPGRVGIAPTPTPPPSYAIDDGVYLRTASSLELTGVALYEQVVGLDVFDSDRLTLIDRLIENHRSTAQKMADLTEGAGAEPYLCTNNWILEREVRPVLDAIQESDQPELDAATLAISFENIAVATHQDLAGRLTASEQRRAVAEASALNARHAAWLAIVTGGPEFYFSPALSGEEVETNDAGILPQYAVPSRFGTMAAIELVVGPEDENGVRSRYTLRTPAENALVYNEVAANC